MFSNSSFGRRLRTQRLFRHDEQRLLVVPLDHSVTNGPITGGNKLNILVGQLATNNVDAVVVHKGSLRHIDPEWFTRTSLVVHLSASTMHAVDPDGKYLVSSVEEALRQGADAVSVHVNLGSLEEHRQIADMAAVADACDRWNVPLLAMVYPRGPKVADPQNTEMVAHAVSLAADLGADLVKTEYVGSVPDMLELTSNAPIPVIVVGGPRSRDDGRVLRYVEDVMAGGAAGVAMGRNIFQAPNPGEMAAAVAERVHRGFGPAPEDTRHADTAAD
ncbi:2-amino-3,7-dideoxy-D-threo-hept-6-ulosonate synthase [Nocardiopsis sp. EMB25]|uniref:2-amino-3,7-dideoxy-D-threo-hept-6-ulosonate synthase n=1 Tax=Nocardiopsis TaxID=2013 RepID=UPI00034C90C1|nr:MULTISPECIES: 2-amino-3,7-dideoxy-D-threo-hept-6-ulosonate synthase [Nocardiopsis]MCY9786947.1 2-amino-3,7-dideoxy-D-threo-hept-6-ulosonate synthase [Nocardiopsis sp. EMB25]